MAGRRRLSAVADAAPPPPARTPVKRRSKSVTEAASKGTRRELLVAMRARVATAVEDPNTPARDLAALTRRLLEIAKEIEAMDARDEENDPGSSAPDESFDASAI